MVSQTVKVYYPVLELPVFSCAFIIGLVLKKFFDATTISRYICPQTTQRLSSSFTDMLVACGVASIKLGVIVKYALPLIVLIIAGVAIVWCITFFLGRRLAKTFWFERMIFAWGWWTGTMAMGIALLRIVDPKLSSKAMDDYAMAYLPIAPIEILLITFVPILFVNGLVAISLLGPFPTDFATGVEDAMVDYSLLILFTGFSFAAFQFWKLTVNNVITVTINKAIKNTHPWIGVL